MRKLKIFILLGIVISCGLFACKNRESKAVKPLSLEEFMEKMSANEIGLVEIYYLSYEEETFTPKSKDELIESAHDCKISLSSDYAYFDIVKQAFSDFSLRKSDELVEASRLACIFYEKKNNRSLKIFFNYNLKSVEIEGYVYSVSEELVNSVISNLPKKSFEYASQFNQTVLKKMALLQ